ncbi:MAG TPA: Hsp20/alpha crystallin family protein [Bacteroidales bacterium]|nr:Hsp20/alpha crystallin family protein [Bacteroidales bacterium]
MTIVRFRPDSNHAFRNEFRTLSDMFDSFFTSPFLPEFTPVFRPMVNVRETESEYQMELSVPGFDKKDISLSVEDHVLAIKGQHKKENQENSVYHRREFAGGEFSRFFELSDDIDTEKIEATHENGILKIRLPKKPEAVKKAPREIHIN